MNNGVSKKMFIFVMASLGALLSVIWSSISSVEDKLVDLELTTERRLIKLETKIDIFLDDIEQGRYEIIKK